MDINTLENKINLHLKNVTDENYFSRDKKPLFDYISAGAQSSLHPVFIKIKQAIDGHLLPSDYFGSEFPGYNGREELSVLSFVFHINRDIVNDNSKMKAQPSYSWYETRHKFDLIFNDFALFLSDTLKGNKILFPVKTGIYKVSRGTRRPRSNWSERHIAFSCGLGSFGLTDAFITERGCAHRLLSAVTDHIFPEYNRPADNLHENCLHYNNISCGKCTRRCPVNAIVPGGHIIEKCYDHEFITNSKKAVDIFGMELAACGLCMCGVPCDTKNPMKKS